MLRLTCETAHRVTRVVGWTGPCCLVCVRVACWFPPGDVSIGLRVLGHFAHLRFLILKHVLSQHVENQGNRQIRYQGPPPGWYLQLIV